MPLFSITKCSSYVFLPKEDIARIFISIIYPISTTYIDKIEREKKEKRGNKT